MPPHFKLPGAFPGFALWVSSCWSLCPGPPWPAVALQPAAWQLACAALPLQAALWDRVRSKLTLPMNECLVFPIWGIVVPVALDKERGKALTHQS